MVGDLGIRGHTPCHWVGDLKLGVRDWVREDEGAQDAESMSTSWLSDGVTATIFVQEPKQNEKTNVVNGTLVE